MSLVSEDLPLLHTRAAEFVTADGRPVLLRGVCLGGWLNMENFITGYAANESLMRTTVRAVLGDDRAAAFFDRLLGSFFAEQDAAFLGESGFNVVRIPVNYRHLESDAEPFVVIGSGFSHLDRAIAQLGAHGVYSVIDLHALPGSQNHHWHSDNATHRASFWEHPHFQDRVVNLWQAIATRYRDNPYVAGYNLMNEPADESRAVIGPFYRRLTSAIREIDTGHIIFLDGNTYATEFDFFDAATDNTVYTLHDYVPAGLGRGKGYPGTVDGVYYDKDAVLRKFLQRSAYARSTGTPIFVGEFGPIYTGDANQDEQRLQILEDQLDIYREHAAGWSIWMYKDLGRQGLVTVQPESAYRRRFDEFVAKKVRLGADQWGSDGEGVVEVTRPVQELMAQEFPDFAPYPWGRFDWTRTLLLNIIMAQPLACQYAELFRGLDDSELDALADSFAFGQCSVRAPLLARLQAG
ncbi:MAG TPA: cellulase family glycosylhydrolase [Dermatophilaceae bacterium]